MEILSKLQLDSFKSFIEKHDYFFIIGHKEPDGDCIASCLAVADILEKFNKKYQLLSAGPFKRSEIIKYKKSFSLKMNYLNEQERKTAGLIILDCSEIQRLGDIENGDFSNLDTYIIDHHKTAELGANQTGFINSNAPACSYLVQLFYEGLLNTIPENVAKILFFGICTDTGFFRFLSTNPESVDLMQASSRLIAYGADPRVIYNNINSGKPYSTRKLLGRLLENSQTEFGGKVIITCETLEDTREWGLEGRDSDSLYQLLLSTKNAKAVVFLRQETPTTCTGGLRSLDDVDVSLIAAKFGGGGHKNAAGFLTEGVVHELSVKILEEFAKIF